MRYVNSVASLASCGWQNVKAQVRSSDGQPVAYIAARSIAVGEEIIADYGVARPPALSLASLPPCRPASPHARLAKSRLLCV